MMPRPSSGSKVQRNLRYSKAQYHTGVMYKLGQGVPENKVFAYMWFSVAVSRLTIQKIAMPQLLVMPLRPR